MFRCFKQSVFWERLELQVVLTHLIGGYTTFGK